MGFRRSDVRIVSPRPETTHKVGPPGHPGGPKSRSVPLRVPLRRSGRRMVSDQRISSRDILAFSGGVHRGPDCCGRSVVRGDAAQAIHRRGEPPHALGRHRTRLRLRRKARSRNLIVEKPQTTVTWKIVRESGLDAGPVGDDMEDDEVGYQAGDKLVLDSQHLGNIWVPTVQNETDMPCRIFVNGTDYGFDLPRVPRKSTGTSGKAATVQSRPVVRATRPLPTCASGRTALRWTTWSQASGCSSSGPMSLFPVESAASDCH